MLETDILPSVVVDGGRPNLLGRNWLSKMKLDWREIFSRGASVNAVQVADDKHKQKDIFERHAAVFKSRAGTLRPAIERELER